MMFRYRYYNLEFTIYDIQRVTTQIYDLQFGNLPTFKTVKKP